MNANCKTCGHLADIMPSGNCPGCEVDEIRAVVAAKKRRELVDDQRAVITAKLQEEPYQLAPDEERDAYFNDSTYGSNFPSDDAE